MHIYCIVSLMFIMENAISVEDDDFPILRPVLSTLEKNNGKQKFSALSQMTRKSKYSFRISGFDFRSAVKFLPSTLGILPLFSIS